MIGTAIKALMKKKGITQAMLAECIGMARQNVNKLLKGKDCKLSTLEKVAHCLEVSPEEIISMAKGNTKVLHLDKIPGKQKPKFIEEKIEDLQKRVEWLEKKNNNL